MNLKRPFDIVFATLGLLIFFPVMALVSIFILVIDGRPILFTQTRLGYHRRPIRIYKFRSMNNDGITLIGRWIRATGLDEIPQFINILKGDMSLVGPRPLTQSDVTRLGWVNQHHTLRWNIKPGVTGLAQLYSGRGARASLFLDLHYVKNHSLMIDSGIVLASFVVNISGKKRIRKILRRYRALKFRG